MKFINLQSYILASNVKKHIFPLPSYINNGIVFIKLVTDDNIYGFGELSPYIEESYKLKNIIDKKIKPIFNGIKISEITFIRSKILKLKIPAKVKATINASITQAYYDILGKYKKKPIYKMLSKSGKKINKIQYYASGGMLFENQDYNQLIDEAVWAQENNYVGWKFRPKTPISNPSHFQRVKNPPNFNIKEIEKFIVNLKKNLNDDFKLMIDVGCRMKELKTAIYFCDFLKDHNFYFIEEPIKYDLLNYKILKKATKLKISGGESFTEINKIQTWIKRNYINFLQPDSNLINLDDIFNLFKNEKIKKKLILHNWCNPISMFSNLNIYKALKSDNIIEYNVVLNPLRDEILDNNFGSLLPSNFVNKLQGLGINISNEILKKYDISHS